MNLKPELLQTMTNLGVTPDELDLLRSRMLSAVTSLQAQIYALNAQIETLTEAKAAVIQQLAQANTTVSKLVVSE